jgi:hypothetical protein
VVDRARLPEARGRLAVNEDDEVDLRFADLPDLGARKTYEVFIKRHGEVTPGPDFGPSANGTCVIGVPGRLEGVEAVLVTRERAGGRVRRRRKPLSRSRSRPDRGHLPPFTLKHWEDIRFAHRCEYLLTTRTRRFERGQASFTYSLEVPSQRRRLALHHDASLGAVNRP